MLVELIDLVNFVIIFLFEMTLLRWLTFLFKSLIVTVTVLFILIDFSIPIRKLLSCCFHWLSVYHYIGYDYSRVDWDDLLDHLKNVPWKDIFELSASTAAIEFCDCVQVYIPLTVNIKSSFTHPHGFQLLVLLL